MPDHKLSLAPLALLAPFLVGCFGLRAGDPFEEIHEFTDSDTASTSTTTDAHAPPLITGTVTTATTTDPTTGDPTTATTTADPIDPPPKIINFTAEPAAILQAAPVVLNAAFTSDVVVVDILDNGETIATVAPLEFPYERMITSDKLDGQHAWDNPKADWPGQFPDHALSVATTPDAALVIAGETRVEIDIVIGGVLTKKTFARAFAQRYSSTGTPDALWIDNLWPDHSGARSITADPKGSLVLTGWTSDQADSGKVPAAFHLDDNLNDTGKQLEKIFFAGEAIAEAGGPSLEEHVILGSNLEEDGESQIRISALLGGDEDPLWAQTFTGPNGVARLNDLTIDDRGYIYFAGFSDVANGGQMLVGCLHP